MIKLSERLQSIADEINQGETMADIGTDHGLLPIYLYKTGKCPKVILTDISKPSLEKAVEDTKTYHSEGDYDFRLGSGIEVLEKSEVDAVAIAGMGGILMTEILGKDIEKTYSFKKLILQPRSHVGRLRYWLLKNGFSVVNEKLVREGKYIWEILTVIPNEKCFDRRTEEDDIEFEYPFTLLKYDSPLLKEYLNQRLAKEKEKLELKKMSKIQDFKVIRTQKHRIEYLDYLLKEFYEGKQNEGK